MTKKPNPIQSLRWARRSKEDPELPSERAFRLALQRKLKQDLTFWTI